MSEPEVSVNLEHLPFFIARPGDTDMVFIAVFIGLILIVLGFGALYFTVQAWPDRIAKGVGKAQMQVVSVLGLVSLLTLNNMLWIVGLVLAAIRIPDIVTPLRDISTAIKNRPNRVLMPVKAGPDKSESEKPPPPPVGEHQDAGE